MQAITAYDIAKAASGVLMTGNGDVPVTGMTLDSRCVKPGDLFVAIPGERCDGHDFAAKAIEDGCSAVLISSRRDEAAVAALKNGAALIKVADTQQALLDLAEWYLSQFPALIRIGVTGSVGKTGTKEMLRRIFEEKYRTICTEGNHNNLLGMPMTALHVDADTEAAIFEMGMDCFGEVHAMAKVARPQAGLITNIGVSHMESLGSRENIRKAKLEMTDFFDSNCTLILNRDNDLLADFLDHVADRTAYKIVTGGRTEPRTDEDLIIEDLEDFGADGISFVLRRGGNPGETQRFRLPLPGKHNACNASLAVAAGFAFGISMKEAAAGLEKLKEADKRLRVQQAGQILLIDDTYNASPDSMRAGLDVLASLAAKRKIALLGDMLDLGSDTDRFHKEVGEYAAARGVSVLWTLGEKARFMAEGAAESNPGAEVRHFSDREEMKTQLQALVKEGDAVLVKGSRAMAMEEMAEIIKQLQQTKE